jgi:hypothetical protein
LLKYLLYKGSQLITLGYVGTQLALLRGNDTEEEISEILKASRSMARAKRAQRVVQASVIVAH